MSTLIYKCPHCGAVLVYDAEKKQMACGHCGSTFSPEEAIQEETMEESFQEQTEFHTAMLMKISMQ